MIQRSERMIRKNKWVSKYDKTESSLVILSQVMKYTFGYCLRFYLDFLDGHVCFVRKDNKQITLKKSTFKINSEIYDSKQNMKPEIQLNSHQTIFRNPHEAEINKAFLTHINVIKFVCFGTIQR